MRRVVGLAAVAALLAVYLLFVDRGPDHPGPVGPGPRTPLLEGFDRGSVHSLSIARAAGAPFSLERQAPGSDPAWRLLPGGWPADGPAVEGLLTALDFAEIARTADTTFAAAGLSPAAVTLTIDGSGGARTLRFGHVDAGGGGVFVASGDQAAVQVAPGQLLDLVDRPAEAYRAAQAHRASQPVQAPAGSGDRSAGDGGAPSGSGGRPLLDFAHFDVRRLRRTALDGTVELVSDDGESWRWATPAGVVPGAAIEAGHATRVASALANLRGERVPPAAAGPPAVKLEVDVVMPGQTTAAHHRLSLAIDQGRGCVGRLDDATSFALSPAACDELRLPLIARGAGD